MNLTFGRLLFALTLYGALVALICLAAYTGPSPTLDASGNKVEKPRLG